ncbi:hypothetical protein ACFVFI_09795 [Streptomyces sp. NPDC057705]|uniref:hypothetical protein n=1 Tax=Streptomyces sp. NPDC057705 TaxID=3346222 RepID=UPI00368F141A
MWPEPRWQVAGAAYAPILIGRQVPGSTTSRACWHLLRKESPERAAELAGRLADMLAILGEDYRRSDVLAWTGAVPASG